MRVVSPLQSFDNIPNLRGLQKMEKRRSASSKQNGETNMVKKKSKMTLLVECYRCQFEEHSKEYAVALNRSNVSVDNN